MFAAALALSVTGCGGNIGVPLSSVPPVTGPFSINGNWQIATATTAGTAPFSALTGSIFQGAAQANGALTAIAILQANGPSTCYVGQTALPASGSLSGTSLSLNSFSIDGQYLVITADASGDGEQLTGKFTINNGCANGVTGNLSGTKIAALSGTYAGTWTATSSPITLTLTQDTGADGLGYFHVQGSAVFNGSPCFTSGTVQGTQSTISGQQVLLTIATNETNGSIVVASGTITSTAGLLTLTSMQVNSGSCAGRSGSATLSR